MISQASNVIVGIDLGTTHSLVAHVFRDSDGVRAEVLPTKEGKKLLPSVVSFEGDGKRHSITLGYQAKDKKQRESQSTAFSVKRLLGKTLEQVGRLRENLPYSLTEDEGGIKINLGEQTFSPIEISSLILKELKEAAESNLGCSVKRAVITVPAYFSDSQRQATRAAGRLAGLEVVRILNEPTAAALAYGLNYKKEGLIAVYDLGGGTFDLSILRLQDGIFEVLATNGDTALGGDDLDQAIADQIVKDCAYFKGGHVSVTGELQALLLEQAERAKIAFSTSDSAEISIPEIGYLRTWTRSEFESVVAPVLERTKGPCLKALSDAGIKPNELTDVVLVGGPTRLRCVQTMAQEIFGRVPNVSLHPDEVVAIGAAIQADILAGNNKDFLLLDVVPLSLGIETYGGLTSTLIARNTRIPASAKEVYTTYADYQTAVDLHVVQGERERVEDNRSLARFKLRGIRSAIAGTPRIEVTFLVDADGILQVSACDLNTGAQQAIEVKPSSGLTEAEIERMLTAQAKFAESDQEHKKLIEARYKAEPLLKIVETQLENAKRLLEASEYTKVEQSAIGLRHAVQGTDVKAIIELSHQLGHVTERLAALILTETLQKR